jgi:DNA-binding transcriptional regulator YiaG
MPNIASALKSEITRLARKEIKSETTQLKRAVGEYRSQIAALKRRAHALEQQLRSLDKLSAKASRGPREETNEEVQGFRFSAKGLASHRKRLGLSAAECGFLLGASGQSIYKWEDGKVRPRAKHMPAIAALRTVSRKQAAEILATRS